MVERIPKLWHAEEPVPLPEHQALFGVDMESYSSVPSSRQGAVSTLVPELVNEALEQAGLQELRAQPRFAAFPGDGYIFGFDPRHLPTVLSPFLRVLDRVLKEFNAHSAGLRCRLRAGIHVGPLAYCGDPSDGNGAARIMLHRLLDCEQLKHVLARADGDGTALAAIISDQVYADVVCAGYSSIHPSCYTKVMATVSGKQFTERAWIYVPSPSGDLLSGIPGHPVAPDPHSDPSLQAEPAEAGSALPRILDSSKRIRLALDAVLQAGE